MKENTEFGKNIIELCDDDFRHMYEIDDNNIGFLLGMLSNTTKIGPFSMKVSDIKIIADELWDEGQEVYCVYIPDEFKDNKFVYYHEIGHIVCGHYDKKDKCETKNGILCNWDFEIEADKFAYDHVGGSEFDLEGYFNIILKRAGKDPKEFKDKFDNDEGSQRRIAAIKSYENVA